MQLNPPKKIVFYISAVVAVVGMLASFVNIPVLSDYAIWVVFLGYVLLFLGNVLKGF